MAGVNEDHPAVDVFEHNGLLAVKLLHALQVEVYAARIAVAEGSSPRGFRRTLSSRADVRRAPSLAGESGAWAVERADAVVVADYTKKTVMLGSGGDMAVETLEKLAPHAAVVQFAGWVRTGELRAAGIPVYPAEEVGPRRMGRHDGPPRPRAARGAPRGGTEGGRDAARPPRPRGAGAADRGRAVNERTEQVDCPLCGQAPREIVAVKAPHVIARCRGCDSCYASTRPTPLAMAEFYDRYFAPGPETDYEHYRSGETWRRAVARGVRLLSASWRAGACSTTGARPGFSSGPRPTRAGRPGASRHPARRARRLAARPPT